MQTTLHLYNRNGTWLFDDAEKGVFEEPFVEGSSEIISEIQNQLGYSGDSLSITFSDNPYDGYQKVLEWKDTREGGTWNQYYSEDLKMYGWLCPVLMKYFVRAPDRLYVSIQDLPMA